MQEPYKAVSILDTAIDIAAMGDEVLKYAADRDVGRLRFIPGKLPTWFYFKRIPVSVFNRYVNAAESEAEKHQRAFVAGVTKVENLVGLDGGLLNGFVEPTGKMHAATGEVKAWSEAELDLIEPAYVAEMGQIAYLWSGLPKAHARRYQVPRLSLQGYMARVSLLAAETLDQARQSSGRAKAQQTRKPASGGGKRTGARATGKATKRSGNARTGQPTKR